MHLVIDHHIFLKMDRAAGRHPRLIQGDDAFDLMSVARARHVIELRDIESPPIDARKVPLGAAAERRTGYLEQSCFAPGKSLPRRRNSPWLPGLILQARPPGSALIQPALWKERQRARCNFLFVHAQVRAVPPRVHVNELGRIGGASGAVERAHHGIDVPLSIAHATEGHMLGELEAKMIAKIRELSTADFLWSDQTLISEVAAFRDGFEVAH